jgi:hypothetical protein
MTSKISRTYWLRSQGGYEIGIATSEAEAKTYQVTGYVRITRDDTMRRLQRGPARLVTIDHIPIRSDQATFAKNLRARKALAA